MGQIQDICFSQGYQQVSMMSSAITAVEQDILGTSESMTSTKINKVKYVRKFLF